MEILDVKRRITESGYTVKEVAEKLGIQTITLYTKMKRNQTVSALQKIADAIGCKVSDFFYEEDENLEADDSNIEKKIVCPNCGKQFFME